MTATALPFVLHSKPYVAPVPFYTARNHTTPRPLYGAAQAGMVRLGVVNGGYRPEHDPNSPAYVSGDESAKVPQQDTRSQTCPCCGSVMQTHQLQYSVFQTCCDNCGVSGPRRYTKDKALTACIVLFQAIEDESYVSALTPSTGGAPEELQQVAEETV